jgi:hypothetical protein
LRLKHAWFSSTSGDENWAVDGKLVERDTAACQKDHVYADEVAFSAPYGRVVCSKGLPQLTHANRLFTDIVLFVSCKKSKKRSIANWSVD